MVLFANNFVSQEWASMADEEREPDVQIRTNSRFNWHQIRWSLVLIFGFIFSGTQIKDWKNTGAIERATDNAETATVAANTRTAEIDTIKKDLAATKVQLDKTSSELETLKTETKQQKLALESWSDFFLEEEIRQPQKERERYRQQRQKVKEILKPISKADPLAGGDNVLPKWR